jgi:hypothetical protein
MEKSVFESVGNTQLFFVLKIINDRNDNNSFDINDIEDSEFREFCDDAGSLVGVSNLEFIDYNYLLSCLLENRTFDFTTKKPEGQLRRPQIGQYSFEVDEFRVESVRRTYRNVIESYSTGLVFPMVRGMIREGEFDYYDGDELETDYFDGDTRDIKLDDSSLIQIK